MNNNNNKNLHLCLRSLQLLWLHPMKWNLINPLKHLVRRDNCGQTQLQTYKRGGKCDHHCLKWRLTHLFAFHYIWARDIMFIYLHKLHTDIHTYTAILLPGSFALLYFHTQVPSEIIFWPRRESLEYKYTLLAIFKPLFRLCHSCSA